MSVFYNVLFSSDNTSFQWAVVIEPVFDAVTINGLPGHVVIRIPQLQVDQSQDLSLVPGQQAYQIIVKMNKVILKIFQMCSKGRNRTENLAMGGDHVCI